MLPGKKYRPEDVLRILRRRWWLLVLPLALGPAITAVWARRMPDLYRSTTLILVVPQRVPESYVKSTITTPLEQRLQSISQQILSRTRLERIIQDFGLYQEERRSMIMEDVVDRMRNTIDIKPVKGDAFLVTYVGREPRTVMKVTERLASLFIEESLQDREVLAEGTNQFLEAQLEDARLRLVDQEKKVETYRRKFGTELPTQMESNLQALQNTQLQIQQLLEALNRDQDRRLVLERQLADLQADVLTAPPERPAVTATGPLTAAQKLEQARNALAVLKLQGRTSDHPDVKATERLIRDYTKEAEAEALARPVSADAVAVSPAERTRRSRITELQASLEQLDREGTRKKNEEGRLRLVAADYQKRAEMAPTRQSEMTELTRDYETLQKLYTSLLGKKEDSKISANLERRQIGEQFKLLDPARVPEKPFSPNRTLIDLIGLVAGFVLGASLIVLLEYRDASFKTDDELTDALQLPVLAVVPFMQSAHERRRSARFRWVAGAAVGCVVMACAAVVAYTLVH